jgi:Fe-S cluster assembly protein SufD
MTLTADRPGLARRDIEIFSGCRHERPESLALRLEALATYLRIEPPDRVRHLWRFTDPGALLPEVVPLDVSPADLPSGAGREEGLAVTLASEGLPRCSPALLAAGLDILPLSDAVPFGAPLGRAVPAEHGLFEALNAATWSSGFWLRVPRGRVLAEPIRVVVPAAGSVSLPRLLVSLDEGAAATVIEEHTGGAATRVIGVSELFVAPGAQLQHILLQRWSAEVKGHLTVRARLARDARFLMVLASLGGSVFKLDAGADLLGPGARSELVGVAMGAGRQHLDHHTLHRHAAGHTWSNLDFRTVMTERARSVYTGLIRIEEAAPQSEAYQENRNLLLGDRTRADSIPELEILTDEVSCTHGATTSSVDAEQMFYLQSRGIQLPHASRLIVRGFLEGALQRLPAILQDDVESVVDERLGRLWGGER